PRNRQHREMAALAGMGANEIELLEQLPTKAFINNEQVARGVLDGVSSKKIDEWMNVGKASDLFKKIVEQNSKSLYRHSSELVKKATRSRKEFQSLNPNLNLSSGNTYFDEKGNAVHLPLGKLSFADEVVTHSLGKPAGKFAERALGKPDYNGDETRNIAHVGYGGV